MDFRDFLKIAAGAAVVAGGVALTYAAVNNASEDMLAGIAEDVMDGALEFASSTAEATTEVVGKVAEEIIDPSAAFLSGF